MGNGHMLRVFQGHGARKLVCFIYGILNFYLVLQTLKIQMILQNEKTQCN
jgi:hypothetical protein